jgi:hypothetical protein
MHDDDDPDKLKGTVEGDETYCRRLAQRREARPWRAGQDAGRRLRGARRPRAREGHFPRDHRARCSAS